MSCKICGRPSPAGAKLCPDCRAARKRAYDATITQPLLALAGAGTVSRTLSRLRRSDASPEAKARRAARKARAAAVQEPGSAASSTPAASRRVFIRSLWWGLLVAGVVVAAVAGWYLPSHGPTPKEQDAPPAALPPQAAPESGAIPAAAKNGETASAVPALPSLPPIDERELVPQSLGTAKPAAAKRLAPPKAETPPEPAPPVEPVRATAPAPVVAAPPPVPRVDPWQQMGEAIGRCPSGFLDRVICEQRVRLQYCDGHWGQVPQCPGGPSVDHN